MECSNREVGGNIVSFGTGINSSRINIFLGPSTNLYITGCPLITVIDSIGKISRLHIGSVVRRLPLL